MYKNKKDPYINFLSSTQHLTFDQAKPKMLKKRLQLKKFGQIWNGSLFRKSDDAEFIALFPVIRNQHNPSSQARGNTTTNHFFTKHR